MAALQNCRNERFFSGVVAVASEAVMKELGKEAELFGIPIQEYAAAAAHPTVIQLIASEDSNAGGYGGVCLNIHCFDMGGEEVLIFPLNTDADNAQKLLSDLATKKAV